MLYIICILFSIFFYINIILIIMHLIILHRYIKQIIIINFKNIFKSKQILTNIHWKIFNFFFYDFVNNILWLFPFLCLIIISWRMYKQQTWNTTLTLFFSRLIRVWFLKPNIPNESYSISCNIMYNMYIKYDIVNLRIFF